MRTKTSIPVPKVLAWCDDAANPVDCEYIIMEHVPGAQLHERWPTMSADQRLECVERLAYITKDMVDLDFPAYGSIYFGNLPLSMSSKIALGDGYYIGPHCGSVYWNCSAGEAEMYGQSNQNHGPCKKTA